jgi:hypothetical protein
MLRFLVLISYQCCLNVLDNKMKFVLYIIQTHNNIESNLPVLSGVGLQVQIPDSQVGTLPTAHTSYAHWVVSTPSHRSATAIPKKCTLIT